MNIEDKLEKGIFASRWLVAPIYIVLCFCLALLTAKVLQQFIIVVPDSISMSIKDVILFVLHVVDLALLANLVLMIIFSGYENFVSKISIAETSEDKPSWMGKVDFSDLKLKLVASIVAISGINLLEKFINLSKVSDREMYFMIAVHLVFVISGVLLALMDFIASQGKKK